MIAEIGTKIREARKRRRISQVDLAQRVGIKQSSLSQIESGTTTPRAATLRTIAFELGDDLGEPELREYLEHRKKSPAVELVSQVVEAVRGNDLVLAIFVARLARAVPEFRAMLDPIALKRASDEAGKALRLLEVMNTGETDKDILEWIVGDVNELDDAQDLGTVDEFDLRKSIERHDDPALVLKEWYRFEGWPMEQLSVPAFKGWDSFTLEQKVNELKAFVEIHRRHLARHNVLPSQAS